MRFLEKQIAVIALLILLMVTPLITPVICGEDVPQGSSFKAISDSVWISIFGVIAPMLFGGLAGAIISLIYNKKRSDIIYRSLLTAYCLEFFYAFERCVTYYKQVKVKNEVSYSSIFEFSDIAFLSRLTEVTKDIGLVKAIVSLKSSYFQIARHVERVSYFIIESEGLRSVDDIQYRKTETQAQIHRGAAIAFFNSSYDKIVSDTRYVLQETKKVNKEITYLLSTFDELVKEKSGLDQITAKTQ